MTRPRYHSRRVKIVSRALTGVVAFTFCLIASLCFVKIDEHYICRGVIRPADEYSVFAPEESIIKNVLVHEDQAVKKGDPLFLLDDWDLKRREVELLAQRREYEARLVQQEKHVERVENTSLPEWLQFAEIDSKRSKNILEYRQQVLSMLDRLQGGGLISKIDYEKAKMELEQAQADAERNTEKDLVIQKGYVESSIAEANAEIGVTKALLQNLASQENLLKQEFERRVLRADLPGTVTVVITREAGEKVARGQELAKISASNRKELHLFGGERNVHKLRPGQRVQFSTETFSPWTEGYCFASVELVAPDSDLAVRKNEDSPDGARYFVKATVEESPAPLKLGATVRAEVLMRRVSIFHVLFNLD